MEQSTSLVRIYGILPIGRFNRRSFFVQNMPKDEEKKTKPDKSKGLINECVDQFDRDFDALSEERATWDDKEALIMGDLLDKESKNNRRSKINSPELITQILKRTNNTMAQLPTGQVQALTKSDQGKSVMMNYILNNYVKPNANTLEDQYTKSWWMEFYSNVYGKEDVLVDYVVNDKYVGPDFFNLNKRHGIPQRGKVSVDDCDRYFVITYRSRNWLLNRDTKNWKNIDKLLEKIPARKGSTDSDRSSYVERKYNSQDFVEAERDDNEEIELITRYEGDRWVTFSRDGRVVLRDCENLHKNNELPIVSKACFPLKDRYGGLGHAERGLTLQYSLNSLINLYMAGVKMSIFQPLKIYLPDVVASTITNDAGAKWILKNNNPNAITEHNRSPQGINTFQATYQFLKGALMGSMGTTDTSTSLNVDPSMGKTPQALKMQSAMDQSFANFDRIMLDKSMERIYNKYCDLLSTRQEKPIKMFLKGDDLEMISRYNPDVVEMFESGKYGQVIIKPSDINKTKYKFFIDSGTTQRKDDEIENQVLKETNDMILQLPGAADQVMKTGKVIIGSHSIDIGESIKRIYITSGVQGVDKIITDLSPEDMEAVEQQKAQEQAAMQAQQQQMMQPPMGQPPMDPMQQGMPQDMGMPPMPDQGMGDMSPEGQQLLNELQGL